MVGVEGGGGGARALGIRLAIHCKAKGGGGRFGDSIGYIARRTSARALLRKHKPTIRIIILLANEWQYMHLPMLQGAYDINIPLFTLELLARRLTHATI